MTPSHGVECGWSGSVSDKRLLLLMDLIEEFSSQGMDVDEATKIYHEEIRELKVVKFRSKKKSRY